MEYLSTLDAGFLEVENSDPRLCYADDLVFGIIADYHAASDVEELAGGIARAAAFHRPEKVALVDDRVRAASGG